MDIDVTKTATTDTEDTSVSTRTRRSAPQARGQVRREKLLSAAIELLEKQDIAEISLADVAAEAGIPVGSTYHFFPNLSSIYVEVLVRYSYEMADFVLTVEPQGGEQWLQMMERFCDRAVEFYESHRAYEQIRLSGKASADIKFSSQRKSGADVVPQLIERIRQYFDLPEIPRQDRIFMNFLHIIDSLYTYTYMEFGCIDEQGAMEAKRAGINYLRSYFPEFLTPR
jgi:AcrR family transcriptional regulator